LGCTHAWLLQIHIQESVSWETTCWGCGLRVVLPRFAPMFSCGWCGAITNVGRSEIKPVSAWSRRCSTGQQCCFVSMVLVAIVSIACEQISRSFQPNLCLSLEHPEYGIVVVVAYGCRCRNLGYVSGALPNSNDGVLCTFSHRCFSFAQHPVQLLHGGVHTSRVVSIHRAWQV
jgi:hypothetical protein